MLFHGNRRIEKKDIIQLDFGCKVNGYCSDFSRVIFIGDVTEEEKKAYHFVLKEQNFIMNQLKDEISIKGILKEAENHYSEENYALLHSFGHGLGLNIHEDPVLSMRYETKLKKNMLVTVEPGVYIPGEFGIRIEDTVLINKEDATSLTKAEKSICILKF